MGAEAFGAMYNASALSELEAELGRALDTEVGLLEADVRRNEAAIAQATAELSDAQRRDIKDIVEEAIRSEDARWLLSLRKALRTVVSGDLADSDRHAVLTRLRSLSPVHVEALRSLTDATDGHVAPEADASGNYYVTLEMLEIDETTAWALVAVGFIHRLSSYTPLKKCGKEIGHVQCSTTPLGRVALLMLESQEMNPAP
jgi:hypothetical protein